MESPVSRLQRSLEELPEAMLPNIGLQAAVMIGLKPKFRVREGSEGDSTGITLRLPTPKEICRRIDFLTTKGRMSSKFLIKSLLLGLEDGFVEQKKEAKRASNIDRGARMLQSLEEEAGRPLDDRRVFLPDVELARMISIVENQMAAGPQRGKFAKKAASAVRRILDEEFPDSYWDEMGLM